MATKFLQDRLPPRTGEAYGTIKRQIIELAMHPGATFTEGELATSLRLSKTPVREALVRLRHEGLVHAVPREGYRVAPVTMKYERDLFNVHALLAGEAGALAALHGADLAEFARLAAVVADLEAEGRSPGALLTCNTTFHTGIAQLTGNAILTRMVTMVWEQVERLLHLTVALGVPVERVLCDCRPLLSAVKSGDAVAAREVATEYTRRAQLVVLDALLNASPAALSDITATGDD
ncbi:MAG: GntR family transcriptional regulator [Chloroflexota bacterium]|nr:GntR family transcriptional regulator [Chloroflexota bacterium]